MDSFVSTIDPNYMFLTCRRKPKHPEGTHTDTRWIVGANSCIRFTCCSYRLKLEHEHVRTISKSDLQRIYSKPSSLCTSEPWWEVFFSSSALRPVPLSVLGRWDAALWQRHIRIQSVYCVPQHEPQVSRGISSGLCFQGECAHASRVGSQR